MANKRMKKLDLADSVPSLNWTPTKPNHDWTPTNLNDTESAYDAAVDGQDGGQEMEDSFDILRHQSAKDLLDANVASYISNEIARKNTQAQLASSGLDNSGYAATTAALQSNALNSELAKNQRAYEDALLGIREKEIDQNNTLMAERAQNITDYIDLYSGKALEDFMKRNGFTLNANTGKWENAEYDQAILDDINERINAKNYQTDYALGISNTTGFVPNSISYEGVMQNINMPSGASVTGDDGVGWEVEAFVHDFKGKTPADGYMVRMTNGHTDESIYLVFRNGRWAQVSGNVAENAWASADEANKMSYSFTKRPSYDERSEKDKEMNDTERQDERANQYLRSTYINPKQGSIRFFEGVAYRYLGSKWERVK